MFTGLQFESGLGKVLSIVGLSQDQRVSLVTMWQIPSWQWLWERVFSWEEKIRARFLQSLDVWSSVFKFIFLLLHPC